MIANAPNAYGIYLHYPYCVSKCHYCDFNSYAVRPDPDWTDGILLQFDRDDPFRTAGKLVSIYFGGGTPSLLSPREVETVLTRLAGECSFQDLEITLETNPGTVSYQALGEFFQAGVNRLSVGVQSFNDHVLGFLGRIHTADEARRVLDDARRAGFENIGLDLILGSRASGFQSLKEDLRAVETFSPDHVSVYFLTIEGKTRFTRRQEQGECLTLSEDGQRQQYEDTISALTSLGLERYEISNLARKGKKSVHNRLYWHGNEYLGLGPGASGFTYEKWPELAVRKKTMVDPSNWLKALREGNSPTGERETLHRDELALERILLELRTMDGLDLQKLAKTYQLDLISEKSDEIRRMVDAGLLVLDDENQRLRLTEEGVFVADSVILALV